MISIYIHQMCRCSASEKDGTGIPTLVFDDDQIHNSNSSNLSSSLDFTKDEIKVSG